jgi:alpha-tubulin suppressor-like RCC1 family protein
VAHSLLLTSAGRVLSFGTAQYGQLGHGYSSGKQLSDALRPQYIEALSHVRCTSVSAGELHSAVVTTDGDLYTWGDGFCGQLGLGDKRPQLLPKQVVLGDIDDEVIVSVSCGCRHTLAVTDDGQVFSFGLGHFGVLGRSFTPFEYDADTAIMDMGEDILPPPMAMVPAANEPALNDEAGVYELTDQTRAQLDLLANLSLDDSSDQCYPVLVDSLEGINIVGACAGYRHRYVN